MAHIDKIKTVKKNYFYFTTTNKFIELKNYIKYN